MPVIAAHLVLAIAASWGLASLFRSREQRQAAGGWREVLATIGVCVCVAVLGALLVYWTIRVLAIIIGVNF